MATFRIFFFNIHNFKNYNKRFYFQDQMYLFHLYILVLHVNKFFEIVSTNNTYWNEIFFNFEPKF